MLSNEDNQAFRMWDLETPLVISHIICSLSHGSFSSGLRDGVALILEDKPVSQ